MPNQEPREDKEQAERLAGVQVVVAANLAEVKRKYGPESGNPKKYHNLDHTQDVMDASIKLADYYLVQGLITPREYDLVPMVASGHDTWHGEGRGIDEDKSAQITIGNMVDAKVFDIDEMTLAWRMIEGTTAYVNGDGRIVQKASFGDSLLAKIIADADLSWIGKKVGEDFWRNALNYLQEREGKNTFKSKEVNAFIREEIEFLTKHEFLTDATNGLFPHKAENIEYLKRLVARY